jgi:hypothetical protein
MVSNQLEKEVELLRLYNEETSSVLRVLLFNDKQEKLAKW